MYEKCYSLVSNLASREWPSSRQSTESGNLKLSWYPRWFLCLWTILWWERCQKLQLRRTHSIYMASAQTKFSPEYFLLLVKAQWNQHEKEPTLLYFVLLFDMYLWRLSRAQNVDANEPINITLNGDVESVWGSNRQTESITMCAAFIPSNFPHMESLEHLLGQLNLLSLCQSIYFVLSTQRLRGTTSENPSI